METPQSQEKKISHESPRQYPVSKPGTVQDLSDRRTSIVSKEGEIINASGHRDQLQRQYGLLSICGIALNINSAWIVIGGSLTISILNGGPPGIIYEFIVAVIFYSFIAASIAELASSMPTSGGVYHWASVTAGSWGRSIGFFCGALNFFGWIFDMASVISIPANVVVQMYANYHPDYVVEAWHSYIVFVAITWLCTIFVIFFNRLISHLQYVGMALIICGGIVTIIVVATMPAQHASNAFVWRDFENTTGWNNGVCFLAGVLNGAFAIGESLASLIVCVDIRLTASPRHT
jgi:choline transport protein